MTPIQFANKIFDQEVDSLMDPKLYTGLSRDQLSTLLELAYYHEDKIGSLELFQLIFNLDFNPDYRSECGRNLMMWPATKGDLLTLKKLYAKGVSVNQPCENKNYPIHLAARNPSSHEAFFYLFMLSETSVIQSTVGPWNHTLIMELVCSRNQNLHALDMLLSKKMIDLEARDNMGNTALMMAVKTDSGADKFELLLKYGADIKTKDNDGNGIMDAIHSHYVSDLWVSDEEIANAKLKVLEKAGAAA